MSDPKSVQELAQRIADGKPISKDSQAPGERDSGVYRALQRIGRISDAFRLSESEDHPGPISVGELWGHLRIEALIGEGGMGQVYRAYDSALDCYVAVKFLSQRARRLINADLFIAEARHMAKVRHPNVLAVFGAATYDQRPGFWSELLEGESLQAQLKPGPLAWADCLGYALNLTNALAVVHRAGLVHGDVKALNVMVLEDRGAVLMDFGAGIDLRQGHPASFARQATPGIMSPQQFAGEPVTQACDIFALGILFYSMATGALPFAGSSIEELSRNVSRLDAVDFTRIQGPRRFRSLIKRMLATEAKQRPKIDEIQAVLLLIREMPVRRARKAVVFSVLGLLAGIAIASAWAFLETRAENEKTQLALADARSYNAILQDVLTTASPLSKGKDTLLLDAVKEAEARLWDAPGVGDAIAHEALKTIAITYANLGEGDAARRTANALMGRIEDVDSQFQLQLMIAKEMAKEGDHQALAEQLKLLDGLYSDPQILDESRAIYWTTKANYLIQRGSVDESEAAVMQALKISQSMHSDIRVSALLSHAQSLTHRSEFSDAIEQFEQASAMTRSLCRCETNVNTLVIDSEIAVTLLRMGEADRGVEQLGIVSQAADEFLGPQHPTAIAIGFNYVSSLNDVGDYAEVVRILEHYQDIYRRQFGENSPHFNQLQNNLANAYLNLERYDKAEPLYRAIIQREALLQGEASISALLATYNLAEMLYKSGRPAEALALAENNLARASSAHGESNLIVLELRDAIGWSLHLLGRHDESQRVLAELLSDKLEILGPQHPITHSTQEHLAAARQALAGSNGDHSG